MCRLAWPGLGARRQPRGAHAVLTPAAPTVKSRPGLSLHHQIGRCVGRSPGAPPPSPLTSLLGINCAVWDCSGLARPHRQHSPQVPLLRRAPSVQTVSPAAASPLWCSSAHQRSGSGRSLPCPSSSPSAPEGHSLPFCSWISEQTKEPLLKRRPLSEASAGGWLFHSFLSSKCHVLEESLGSTRRKVAPGVPARSPVLVLMCGSVPPTRPQVPQEPRPRLSLFRPRPALSGAPWVFGG